VDDKTYDRLNQIALANGQSLSDMVRAKLSLETWMKMSTDEVEKRVHEVAMTKMRKEAEEERGKQYYFDLRVYKSVDKRIRLYWRSRPLTDYDAIQNGHPDKAGMWELIISKETKDPDMMTVDPARRTSNYRGGEWYMVEEERKYHYKRRGLFKAINSLCRHYGQPELYRMGARAVPPNQQPPTP